MSTAVLDEPQVARQPEWRMPPIEVGQDVFWYEYAKRERQPQRAVVESVIGDTISCRLVTGGLSQYKSCARHVDDPSIVRTGGQNVADADQGGWDYTPEHKREVAWRKSVEDRLMEMKAQFDELAFHLRRIDRSSSGVLTLPKNPPSLEDLEKDILETTRPKVDTEPIEPGFVPPADFKSVAIEDDRGSVTWDATPVEPTSEKKTNKKK